MLLKLKTAPAIEPVTLAEVKAHLRLDSQSLADNLAYEVLALLEAGTCGAGGSVAAKLQESANGITGWTDWTGGAFTTVTEANDNATQEKAYTGTQPYIRVVATVAGAACEFGVSVLKSAPYSIEDTYLAALIIMAREYIEVFCGPLITQTWEQYEAAWPVGDRLAIGKARLQTVESLKYTDENGVEATFAAALYSVDTVNEYRPGVVLKYLEIWPTVNLFNLNPIVATLTCGYGAAAGAVPVSLKHAMLLLCAHWYEERQPILTSMSSASALPVPLTIDALMANYRTWGF